MLHASAVHWRGKGILIEGPSCAGKSDLCCRLVASGGMLVADDTVLLRQEAGRIVASAPPAAARGDQRLLELRGQGIFAVTGRAETAIDLVVQLTDASAQERLPAAQSRRLLDQDIACIALDGRAASAADRIGIVLTCERVA